MKIKFKKKRLYSNLFIGLVFLALGVFQIVEAQEIKWFDYGYLIISFFYFLQFFYECVNQYITIENGNIKKNVFFGKGIKMTEINEVKKFAGEYILKTQNQNLRIDINIIEKKSLEDLRKILEKHELIGDKAFINAVKI